MDFMAGCHRYHSDGEKTGVRRPAFLDDPIHSLFHVCSRQEEREMSADMMQKRLRTQHIVIRGDDVSECDFSLDNLEECGDIDEIIDIQGASAMILLAGSF